MKKTLIAMSIGIVSAVAVTTQIAGPLVAQQANSQTSVYEQLELFGDIFERVRQEYVEDVNDQELIESAIDGMLRSLDPHSSFLSAADAADMRIQTR
jgi:carboxyl-terminal processing protease